MHGVRGEGVGAVIRTKSRRPEGAGQLDYERPARALQRWKGGEEETGKREKTGSTQHKNLPSAKLWVSHFRT